MGKKCVFTVVVVMGLFAVSAWSATGYNAQLFWPSIFGGNFIAIEDSNVLCKMGVGGALYLNYANGPVEVRINDEPKYDIVNQLLSADIIGAFSPLSFLGIGIDVPVHLWAEKRTIEDLKDRSLDDIRTQEGVSDLKSEIELGDIRAELKIQALRQSKHWLGLALAPYVTFPTGDPNSFLGEGRVTAGGTLILEHDFDFLNLALNGGYQFRGAEDIATIKVGNSVKFGAGVSKEFNNGLSFSVEYWASIVETEDEDRFQGNPMEVIGTIRYKFGENKPRVVGGGGAGLTSGVGCPAWRALLGVDYAYCKPAPTEGRLVIEAVDQNDKPLEVSLKIKGPESLETRTNSKGKWDSKVKPGEYEVTGTKEGCYLSDTRLGKVELGKTTTVKLTLKSVPTTLTVIVTDKKGNKIASSIAFDVDTPKEKRVENPTGEFSQEWAPGAYKMVVSAKGYEDKFVDVNVKECKDNVFNVQLRKKIEKIGNIYFDYDSDVIRKESYPVLDNVVEQIKQLGKYKKVIIEGHCSSEGTDEYNMDLSRRRALAVKKYLVSKGLDPAKLEIAPYGESRPIASNETEEGRAKNRRVEFIIEEEE